MLLSTSSINGCLSARIWSAQGVWKHKICQVRFSKYTSLSFCHDSISWSLQGFAEPLKTKQSKEATLRQTLSQDLVSRRVSCFMHRDALNDWLASCRRCKPLTFWCVSCLFCIVYGSMFIHKAQQMSFRNRASILAVFLTTAPADVSRSIVFEVLQAILAVNDDEDDEPKVVDLEHAKGFTREVRKELLTRALETQDMQNERFLMKVRARLDRYLIYFVLLVPSQAIVHDITCKPNNSWALWSSPCAKLCIQGVKGERISAAGAQPAYSLNLW